jgi:hypothetical protein
MVEFWGLMLKMPDQSYFTDFPLSIVKEIPNRSAMASLRLL